jgi:hypothetical protein
VEGERWRECMEGEDPNPRKTNRIMASRRKKK